MESQDRRLLYIVYNINLQIKQNIQNILYIYTLYKQLGRSCGAQPLDLQTLSSNASRQLHLGIARAGLRDLAEALPVLCCGRCLDLEGLPDVMALYFVGPMRVLQLCFQWFGLGVWIFGLGLRACADMYI